MEQEYVEVMTPEDGDTPGMQQPTADQEMWAAEDDCYFGCEQAVRALPPGQYIPADGGGQVCLVRKTVTVDDLMVLPDSRSEHVLAGIRRFWTLKEAFARHGFLWKRGVLLCGPPGSGKTSTLQQISSQVIAAGGISVCCNSPRRTARALQMIRSIEPERPIVLIMEDLDAIIERHGESDLLALLDGELQIDNVLNIATTNYPERLDPRIVQRPSRFDEIVKIGMPSAAARDAFLQVKNPGLGTEERARWVACTEGFSIAALKEVIVSVACLGRPLEETVERISRMLAHKPSSQDGSTGIGFLSGRSAPRRPGGARRGRRG